MNSPASGWRPPLCDSRTGAAHQRRGAPCQDASGVWSVVDAGRQVVQLLVVSDGHGGSRYDRSDVGSRLACRVALQSAQEWLACRSLQSGPPDAWRQWLAADLPRRIVERWSLEVLAHAEAHPRADGAAPSTISYGATLGLLLLTPHWWGLTGLGDWDLVRIAAEGRSELVSEEPGHPGGGEATFSLCMEGAERYFAPRSSVHPIPADAEPFSLLLSSDGIRKSCSSDADFLTLAGYLCGLPPAQRDQQTSELSLALDHISGQGSGDDVSVAIGRWGPLSDAEQRQLRRRTSQLLIVQPALAAPGGATPSPAGPASQAADPGAAAGGIVPPEHEAGPESSWRRASPWLIGLLGGLAMVAAGVGAALMLGWGPFARRQPAPRPVSPEQLALVRNEAQRLCAGQGAFASEEPAPQPTTPGAAGGRRLSGQSDRGRLARIRGTLNQRKAIFLALRQGTQSPDQLLREAAQDPLGTLVIWSARQPGLGPFAPDPAASRQDLGARLAGVLAWRPGRSLPEGAAPAPQPVFPFCPELQEALRQQWRATLTPTSPLSPSANR